jgi:hypothetical protein
MQQKKKRRKQADKQSRNSTINSGTKKTVEGNSSITRRRAAYLCIKRGRGRGRAREEREREREREREINLS